MVNERYLSGQGRMFMNKRLIMAIIFLSMVFYNLTVCGEEAVSDENIITDQTGEFQYSINSDGTATMLDYLGGDKEIEIPHSLDGIDVTAIGGKAFELTLEMRSLHKISISEGITRIGKGAFLGCELENMVIPADVETIDEGAFFGCYIENLSISSDNKNYGMYEGALYEKASGKLIACFTDEDDDSYVIPDNITSIGDEAFFGNWNLKSITIPASVIDIGDNVFLGCDLENINISGDNENYELIDEALFQKKNKKLILYLGEKENNIYSLPEETAEILGIAENNIYSIPEGTTEIGGGAFFMCHGLCGVEIPDSIVNIGDYAFAECVRLTGLEIPDSVTSIGDYAFSGCHRLGNICIPGSVSSIGKDAFVECCLENIEISADNEYYAQIDGVLFEKASKKLIIYPALDERSTYSIPSGIEIIEDGAFYGSSNLYEIEIPSSVTFIGASAFECCSNLYEIKIPEGITDIKDNTFYDCGNLGTVEIPASVTTIRKSAFENCYNLYEIEIPENVTTIGNSVFSSCYSLTDIYLPDTIVSIGDYAFWDCENLDINVIPQNVVSIGKYAFQSCNSLSSIIIPEGTISIGNGAFEDCENLNNIEIPTSVTDIGEEAFGGCSSLASISVSPDNNCYAQIDGVLFDKEYKKLIAYPAGKETSIYNIPEGVMEIGDGAFAGCENLYDVIIPDGTVSIRQRAFRDCSNLNSVTIPASVISIDNNGYNLFGDYDNLTLIVDHDSYASRWAKEEGIEYTYPDANDWLLSE